MSEYKCDKCEDQKQFYVKLACLDPILVDCDECQEVEKDNCE